MIAALSGLTSIGYASLALWVYAWPVGGCKPFIVFISVLYGLLGIGAALRCQKRRTWVIVIGCSTFLMFCALAVNILLWYCGSLAQSVVCTIWNIMPILIVYYSIMNRPEFQAIGAEQI